LINQILIFLTLEITIAGAIKYIPTFIRIIPIPYPRTDSSESNHHNTHRSVKIAFLTTINVEFF